MKKCYDCAHVEMCGWRKEVKEQGCEFFDDGMVWIPCSERSPNYRETVLISTFWGVRVAERDAVKEDGTDDFWYLFLDDATAHPRYVYAWMPLPEPYAERKKE